MPDTPIFSERASSPSPRCYARVSINFYAFNTNGNKGIACGLGNIQKVRDGEPLSGRTSAADDFATDLDDDFLS